MAQPIGVITHAVTIDVPPEAVWPWLIQLGSGRAGWYAYDRIDNGGRPSARRIIPALQQIAVGDVLPALPDAKDMFVVGDVRPNRALILIVPLRPHVERSLATAGVSIPTARASWALVLEPLAPGRTRLIARSRISREWLAGPAVGSVTPSKPHVIERIYGLLATMPVPLMLAVAGGGHYLMESRMLRGIKRRAERGDRPAAHAGCMRLPAT